MLIFLHGEDTFRSYQKMEELKERFIREVDPSRVNLTILDEKTNPESLRQALFSPPFLARKRMVVIPDLLALSTEARNEIIVSLEKKLPEEVIFVVRLLESLATGLLNKELSAKFKASKYAEEFKLLRGKYLEKVVAQMITKAGCQFSFNGLQALIALTAGDLWQIKNEILKLAAYAQGRKIDSKEVLKLVSGSFDENIFNLLDAIANHQPGQALMYFEAQVSGGASPRFLLNRITGYIRLLLAVQLLRVKGETMNQISKELALHPYVSGKISKQIQNWDLTKLKEAYKKLLLVETKTKTGRGDAHTLLSVFISSF